MEEMTERMQMQNSDLNGDKLETGNMAQGHRRADDVTRLQEKTMKAVWRERREKTPKR
jgi:hypothetical protein